MKEQLLEVVVKEMQQGVVIINDKGLILYANPFFQETFAINLPLKGINFT